MPLPHVGYDPKPFAHTHTSILERGRDETTVMVGMSAEWNAYAKGSRKWGDLVRRSGFATKWATKRVTGARDRAGTNALGHEARDGGKGEVGAAREHNLFMLVIFSLFVRHLLACNRPVGIFSVMFFCVVCWGCVPSPSKMLLIIIPAGRCWRS